MRLVFKKGFGLDTIPSDIAMWLLELESSTYAFVADQVPVSISRGTFGNTDQERNSINQFVSTSRRPFGHKIQTLDVTFEMDGAIPEAIKSGQHQIGSADAFVEPYIDPGFHAVRAFVETYRDCKYLRYRGQERWTNHQTLLPRVTEQEFRTLLFYTLDVGDGEPYVGSFSDGRLKVSNFLGSDFTEQLRRLSILCQRCESSLKKRGNVCLMKISLVR